MMEAGTYDLIDALKSHNYSTSKHLLEYGADPNCISPEDGVSPFHLAVGLDSKSSLKLVELCIQYGGNPNVRSYEGMTPVMVAASWGRFQALQMLLANGGDPKLQDEDFKNALDHAIGAQSWDCRQLLQEHMTKDEDDSQDDEPNFYYEPYYTDYSDQPSLASPCSQTSLFENSKESDEALHGFDVTSPDHPFAFIKNDAHAAQLNKTVIINKNASDLTHVTSLHNNSQLEQTALIQDEQNSLEFLYCDEECGVSLIEKRCMKDNMMNESTNLNKTTSSTSDETIMYDWQDHFKAILTKSEEDIKNLSCEQLNLELIAYGYNPGPITATTKDIYTNKLIKLKEDKRKSKEGNVSRDYSQELSDFMQVCTILDAENADVDEEQMCAAFQNPDPERKWREGVIKSSFNYLLLDPRVTRNLPHRGKSLTDSETFQIFLSAVFYIGKGKRGRPYAHFYEGLEQLRNPRLKPSDKVQHIVDIWGCGLGVVSLHVFQGVIPVEAYTREACMVDSLTLARLTNARRGDYYGVASTWSKKRQRNLGSHLLHKCMQIFMIEGERQIRPADLHGGKR